MVSTDDRFPPPVAVLDLPAPAAEEGRDAVASWFGEGGGRRLEKLVDLLSLDPLPVEQEVA